MGRGAKLLEQMRANPRDWRIEDVITICRAFDVTCTRPPSGSHYKVKDRSGRRMFVVPAHRPIKPVYIQLLVDFLDDLETGDED